MDLFEIRESIIAEQDEEQRRYWEAVFSKSRHGLDSPYHVLVVEVLPPDEDYPEEGLEYELLHPEKCSDEANCEFVDFEPDVYDFTTEGRYFVEMSWSQDYWGEWDSELIDHGTAPDPPKENPAK